MCECIRLINEQLEERNTHISRKIAYKDGELKVLGAVIETYKIDSKKRGKPFTLLASYCPFCGEKYDSDTDAAR